MVIRKNYGLTTANSLGSGWSDFLSWSSLGSESRGSLVLVLDNGKLGGLFGTTSFDRVVTAVTLGDVLNDQFAEVTRPSFFVFQDAKIKYLKITKSEPKNYLNSCLVIFLDPLNQETWVAGWTWTMKTSISLARPATASILPTNGDISVNLASHFSPLASAEYLQ